MVKKIGYCAIIIGLMFVFVTGCGTKKATEGSSNESVETNDESESVSVYKSRKTLDSSEELSDISLIKEQNITEARIYANDKTFSTYDEAVIEEIVNKISNLNVVVTDEETDVVYGASELYLLDGNKVVYHFLHTDTLYVGGRQYGPKEEALKFETEVMGYCRETFYR